VEEKSDPCRCVLTGIDALVSPAISACWQDTPRPGHPAPPGVPDTWRHHIIRSAWGVGGPSASVL